MKFIITYFFGFSLNFGDVRSDLDIFYFTTRGAEDMRMIIKSGIVESGSFLYSKFYQLVGRN